MCTYIQLSCLWEGLVYKSSTNLGLEDNNSENNSYITNLLSHINHVWATLEHILQK